ENVRVYGDSPKITIGRLNVLVAHEDLHDEQGVDRRSGLGELLESGEHHAGERGTQLMGCCDEPAALRREPDDLLICALANGCAPWPDEEWGIGLRTATPSCAVKPRRAVQREIR